MGHLERVHLKDKDTEIYLEVQKLREIIATTRCIVSTRKPLTVAFGGYLLGTVKRAS